MNYELWLSWVKWYLANGFDITPVVRGGKRPLRKNWPNIITTLDEFKQNYRRCNLAVKTTQWTVIDNDGAMSLEQAIAQFGDTQLICQTGRKGHYHLYYWGASNSGNRVRIQGQSVDMRSGRGGAAIVPPSITVGTYKWLRLGRPARWTAGQQLEPARTRTRATAKHVCSQPAKEDISTYAVSSIDLDARRRRAAMYIATFKSESEKQGDLQLFRAACFLVQKFDLPPEIALAELVIWNEHNAVPPWPHHRLVYKVNQAWSLKNATQ